jgi:hypothetical protein
MLVMTKFFSLILLLGFPLCAPAKVTLTRAQTEEAKKILFAWWPEAQKFSDQVFTGKIVSWADVTSSAGKQKMSTRVVGLHSRTCNNGLRKMSLYEDYPRHMSFIKEAQYQAPRVRFVLDHSLLPFPMELTFDIPRIRAPGSYPFIFPSGIFRQLHGHVRVASIGGRCLYFLETEWQGTPTKIPDTAVRIFAQTLSELGLEHLFRVSAF